MAETFMGTRQGRYVERAGSQEHRLSARHPLGASAAFFGIWIAALSVLCSATPYLVDALAGSPASLRLSLEAIALASAAVPSLACPLLFGGGRHGCHSLARIAFQSGAGLAAGTAWLAASLGILAALGAVDLGAASKVSGLPLWIAACAINAAMQEVLIHGYAFCVLAESRGSAFAVLATTALFVLLHPGAFTCGPIAVLEIAASGILLAEARLISGSLAFPIAMHAAWNAVGGIVFGTISLADDYPSIFSCSLEGPAFLAGGSMGIEGSIAALALTCILCAAAVAIHRGMQSNLKCE